MRQLLSERHSRCSLLRLRSPFSFVLAQSSRCWHINLQARTNDSEKKNVKTKGRDECRCIGGRRQEPSFNILTFWLARLTWSFSRHTAQLLAPTNSLVSGFIVVSKLLLRLLIGSRALLIFTSAKINSTMHSMSLLLALPCPGTSYRRLTNS